MGKKEFILALARGARGKDAAKALVLPDFIGAASSLMGKETLSLTAFAAPTQKVVTKKSKVTACTVSFTPSQDLHGYDSPWPAGGGKNKFFHGTELSGQYIQQTGIVASADGWKVSDYIPVLPNTQYTFNPNTTGGNSAYAACYNENKSKKGSTIPSGKQTFTTYEDTAYMRFSFRATSADIQLELGSTDTAFAPYSNICPISGWQGAEVYIEPTYDPTATPKASVTFGQTVYGGTYDAVSGDGMITWATMKVGNNFSLASGNVFAYSTSAPKKPVNNITAANILSSQFKTSSQTNLTTGFNIAVPATADVIRINAPGYTSDEAFIAAFSECVICYELATPIPFTFPPASSELILQKGDNYNWADMTND